MESFETANEIFFSQIPVIFHIIPSRVHSTMSFVIEPTGKVYHSLDLIAEDRYHKPIVPAALYAATILLESVK